MEYVDRMCSLSFRHLSIVNKLNSLSLARSLAKTEAGLSCNLQRVSAFSYDSGHRASASVSSSVKRDLISS
jgi:hypothetical protein